MATEQFIKQADGRVGLGFATNDLIAKANAMVAQTQAQGATPFARSSYDTAPSNVSQINPLPSPQMPDTAPSLGNVSNALAMNSGMDAQIKAQEKYFADQADLAKQQADALQAEQSQAKSSLLNIFSTTPSQTQTRASAYQQIGIDPSQYFADQKSKMAEIGTLTEEYNALKAAAEQQKASLIGQGRGITQDFLNNQAAQIDRNAAPRLNMLSANINSKAAVLQALQGNFNEARSFVNQAVEDATADTKFKVDTITAFYNINQDAIGRLDTKYQNALSSYMDLAKTEYETQRTNAQSAGEAMLRYNSLGAGISVTDSPEVVAQKAAAVGGDLAVYAEQQRIQDKYSATKSGGATTVPPTEYSSLVSTVGNLYTTAVRGESVKNSLSAALSSGDYVGAYAQVANAVEESLKGTAGTTFADSRTDYGVMQGLRSAVEDYANGGGDMGLLTGTEEDIKRKLGIDSGKASALAVQLWREFQTYRLNMTGAAFGASESRDYAAVNPTLGKSLNLNLSVIDGALNQLENRITSTINARVPGSSKIYEKIKPVAEQKVTTEDDSIFAQAVNAASPQKGFWSNLWSGITGK